jgi:hypothetical protein
MFLESFYMIKTLKKTMWTSGFFVSKVFFPYQMFIVLIRFFVNFNIFHKNRSMCSKHSKKYKYIYTLLDFNTQMSLNTIIVLN